MSYPVGTKIGAPLTNGSIQASYGTHLDYLGVGGYRTVETLDLRDAIPVKYTLEFDGASSGMRRPGMIVHVLENERTYRLDIPGYAAMNDQNKYAALSSNTNWLEVEFGIGGAQGDTVTAFNYDPTTYALTLTTDRSTQSVDLSSLNLGGTGTTVTTVTLAADYTLALNLSDGGQRTVSLAALAQDTKLTGVDLTNGNLLEFTLSDGTSLVVDLSTIQPDLSAYALTSYVDTTNQALQALIATEKNRLDTLVDGAPEALDTLKEIANQLATDEQGAAAILATQQDHTQQLDLLKPLMAGTGIELDEFANEGFITINAQPYTRLTIQQAQNLQNSKQVQPGVLYRIAFPAYRVTNIIAVQGLEGVFAKDGYLLVYNYGGGITPTRVNAIDVNAATYEIAVQPDLTSNSATAVPSIKAVKDALKTLPVQDVTKAYVDAADTALAAQIANAPTHISNYIDRILAAITRPDGSYDLTKSTHFTVDDVVSFTDFDYTLQAYVTNLYRCLQTYDDLVTSLIAPSVSPTYWFPLVTLPAPIKLIPDGVSASNPYQVDSGQMYSYKGVLYRARLTSTLTSFVSTIFDRLAGSPYKGVIRVGGNDMNPGDLYYCAEDTNMYEAISYGGFSYYPIPDGTHSVTTITDLVSSGYLRQYFGLASVDYVLAHSGTVGGSGTGNNIVVEQDLSSGSITSVPSVKAVGNALVDKADVVNGIVPDAQLPIAGSNYNNYGLIKIDGNSPFTIDMAGCFNLRYGRGMAFDADESTITVNTRSFINDNSTFDDYEIATAKAVKDYVDRKVVSSSGGTTGNYLPATQDANDPDQYNVSNAAFFAKLQTNQPADDNDVTTLAYVNQNTILVDTEGNGTKVINDKIKLNDGITLSLTDNVVLSAGSGGNLLVNGQPINTGSSVTLPPMIIPLVMAQSNPITTTQADTSTTASVVIGSDFVWDVAYATGKTVKMEICCSATAGKTLAASLYTLAGVNVSNSGISGFSSSPGLARTGTFTLTHNTTYQVRIAVGSGTGYLYSARLIIK